MRVAIFCNEFWPAIGGVPTAVRGLAHGLERRGHATLVLTQRAAGTRVAEVVDGTEVRRFRWNLRPRVTFPLRAMWSTVEVLRTVGPWRPDVVYAHFVSVHAVYGWACARRSGVPLILSFRGNDAMRIAPRNGVTRRAYRFLVGAAAANLFCSPWLLDHVRGAEWFRSASRLSGVLADAVEVAQRERFSTSAGPYVLAAGRFVHKKGFDLLLRAWSAVAGRLPAQLWIAGDGPERAALERLVEAEGIEGSVRLLGAVPHAKLLGILAAACLCVVPSREEPYGIIVLESQALGVPVLACAVGNIPSLVQHGLTGYLVSATEGGLAQGLLEAWNDPRRADVGLSGKRAGGATRGYDAMATELEAWLERVSSARARAC